jgi:MFS family permease
MRKKLTAFLGLQPSIVAVLLMAILVGMGEKMAERFLPIYLMALGGGALTIGLLNGMDNLLSALYSFPGGYLSDRLGYKRALLIFNLVAMIGYGIVIVFPSWQAILVGAALFLSWSAVSQPATMSLVASVLPFEKRTMGASMLSIVRRIPMALGPLLGGLLISLYGEVLGVRLAFGAALLLGLVSLVFQQLKIKEQPKVTTWTPTRLRDMGQLIPPDLRILLTADVLVRFCEQIPYAFVVVWVVKNLGISPFQFGLLTSVEMVTAMLVYIPVAYFADRSTKKPFVVITFAFFTLFPLLLTFSRTMGALVVAFIVRGLKEFGEPARKTLILDYATSKRQASSFGAYYLVRDVLVSIAAFGGAFLWLRAPSMNFLVAFGFGLVGTLFFAVKGKSEPKPVTNVAGA